MKKNILFYFFIGLIFVVPIKEPVVNFLGNLGSVGLNEDITLLANGQYTLAKTIATPFDYTKNKDYECYWIVDIYQKKVYSYLEKDEFLKKKDALSIHLYFKNIDKFF